jgi:hypothetical protein
MLVSPSVAADHGSEAPGQDQVTIPPGALRVFFFDHRLFFLWGIPNNLNDVLSLLLVILTADHPLKDDLCCTLSNSFALLIDAQKWNSQGIIVVQVSAANDGKLLGNGHTCFESRVHGSDRHRITVAE